MSGQQVVEVYDDATDRWNRGVVLQFLPEVGRFLCRLDDGSKKLLSREKHVFRFIEAEPEAPAADEEEIIYEEDQAAAVGGAVGGRSDNVNPLPLWPPAPQEGEGGPPEEDIDLEALKNEQRQYDDWLKGFGETVTNAPVSVRSPTAASVLSASSSPVKTASSTRKSPSPSRTAAQKTTVKAKPAEAKSSPAGASVSAAPSTLAKATSSFLPDPAAPWRPYGFVRSDAAAEKIAATVLLNSNKAATGDASSSPSSSLSSGLLSLAVLQSRGLASCVPQEGGGAGQGQGGHLSLRVYVIRTPLDVSTTLSKSTKGGATTKATATRGRQGSSDSKQRGASASSKGRTSAPKRGRSESKQADFEEDNEEEGPRLHVPARINPMLCERNLLFRVDSSSTEASTVDDAAGFPAKRNSANNNSNHGNGNGNHDFPPIGLSASSSELMADAAVEALMVPVTTTATMPARRNAAGRPASGATAGAAAVAKNEPAWPQRTVLASMATPKAVEEAAAAAAAAANAGASSTSMRGPSGVPAIFFGASTVLSSSSAVLSGGPSTAALAAPPLPFPSSSALSSLSSDVKAVLDWWHLSGYLLFQVYWEKPSSSTSSATATTTTKGDRTRQVLVPPSTSVLVAQGLLRVCDIFAGLRWDGDEDSGNSRGPLSRHLSSAHGVNQEEGEGSASLTEFELGVWLPLKHVAAATKLGSNAHNNSTPPPAVLVQASILLPRSLYTSTSGNGNGSSIADKNGSGRRGSGNGSRLSAGGPSGALTAYGEGSSRLKVGGSGGSGHDGYGDEEFAPDDEERAFSGARARPLTPGPGSEPPGAATTAAKNKKGAAAAGSRHASSKDSGGLPRSKRPPSASGSRSKAAAGPKTPSAASNKRPQTAPVSASATANADPSFGQVIYPLTTVAAAAAAQQEQQWLEAQQQQEQEHQMAMMMGAHHHHQIPMMTIPPPSAFGDGGGQEVDDAELVEAAMRQTRPATAAGRPGTAPRSRQYNNGSNSERKSRSRSRSRSRSAHASRRFGAGEGKAHEDEEQGGGGVGGGAGGGGGGGYESSGYDDENDGKEQDEGDDEVNGTDRLTGRRPLRSSSQQQGRGHSPTRRRSASRKKERGLLRGEALPPKRANSQARAITMGRLRNSAKEAMIAGHPSALGSSFAAVMANASKTAKRILSATGGPAITAALQLANANAAAAAAAASSSSASISRAARPSTASGVSRPSSAAAAGGGGGGVGAVTGASSLPVFGSPWQALGAQNLPPGIRPDDYKALKALIDDLVAQRTRLQERLHLETVATTRARLEVAAVKKFHVLLTKEPSPLVNLARARVSTLAAAGGGGGGSGAAGDGGSGSRAGGGSGLRSRSPDNSPSKLLSGGASGLSQLKRKISEAQARVLMLLAQRQRLLAEREDRANAEEMEKEKLRRDVAAMRGRLIAMRERLQRQEALRKVALAAAAADDGSAQAFFYQQAPSSAMEVGALMSAAAHLSGLHGQNR